MTSLMALRPSAISSSSSSILPTLSPRRSRRLCSFFSPAPAPALPKRTPQEPLSISPQLGFCCKKKDAVDLEGEILAFMDKSQSPNKFPTREQLIAGGRADLAKAVARERGWMAYGWHLNGEEEEEDEEELDEEEEKHEDDLRPQNSFSEADDANPSSARTTGLGDEEEAGGIEGILSGLEKERSLSFGVGFPEKRVNENGPWRNAERDRGDAVFIANKKVTGSIGRSSISTSAEFDEQVYFKFGGAHSRKRSSGNANGTDAMPMWRIWSLQRAGNPASEFEAAEIISNEEKHVDQSFNDDHFVDASEVAGSVSKISEGNKCSKMDAEEIFQDQIHLRIKRLESELTSVLGLVRSTSEDADSLEDQESQLKELHRLSDELEYKQTEIMNAKGELRSRRAKLAIQQGKMTHKLIEEQKRLDVTKKRLDAAQKALCLLRTTCIVWPRSASEVLLAGSFDGWTSQRRMERSKSGIFTLYLKLYPGRYEIKFIVDGVWMVDPLRPTVWNSGYENNLLIVT